MKFDTARKPEQFFYLLILLFVIILLLVYIMQNEKRLILYPGNNVQAAVFGDYNEEHGNSFINTFEVKQDQIILTYTLKAGYINPYAGFSVSTDKLLNIKPFDTLSINLKSSYGHSLQIFLLMEIPGYSLVHDFSSYLHLQKEILLLPGSGEYHIKLSDLYIPEWWSERKLSKNDPRLIMDFTKVYCVSIQSGLTEGVDITDVITLKEISFYKSKAIKIFAGGLILIVCLVIACLFFFLKKYKKRLLHRTKKQVIPYKDIKLDADYNEEAAKIIRCIGENYYRNDLTTAIVGRMCTVSTLTISRVLKKHFDTSFPQYLNSIRLTEAKRLLTQTDHMISDIAFAVGFSSVVHFNRIFKKSENISPKNFRREIQNLQ